MASRLFSFRRSVGDLLAGGGRDVLEGDGSEASATEVVEDDLRGFRVVDVSTLHDAAAAAADLVEDLNRFLEAFEGVAVARDQCLRVIAHDVFDEVEYELVNVQDLVVDGADDATLYIIGKK